VVEHNIDYMVLTSRVEQELLMAGRATCIEAKTIHLNLAALYAAQSEAVLSQRNPGITAGVGNHSE
jgi:hypothetical protein